MNRKILAFKPSGREREPRDKPNNSSRRAKANNMLRFRQRGSDEKVEPVISRGSRPLHARRPTASAPALPTEQLGFELFCRMNRIVASKDRAAILYWLPLLRSWQSAEVSEELKAEIIRLDKSTCCMCGFVISEDEITVVYDLVPRRGGTHTLSNLHTACFYCAGNKGGLTIAQYREKPISPRGGRY